jgi:hypothetical protein
VGVVLGDQAQGGAGRFEFANICITATNVHAPPTQKQPFIFSSNVYPVMFACYKLFI